MEVILNIEFGGDTHAEGVINMIKSTNVELTPKEIKYVSNKIRNEVRRVNDPCMDNFRICSGEKWSNQYAEQRDKGCCGFTDIKIELKSGKIFHFGFNFGH